MDWDWDKVNAKLGGAVSTLKELQDDKDAAIPDSTWTYIEALRDELRERW